MRTSLPHRCFLSSLILTAILASTPNLRADSPVWISFDLRVDGTDAKTATVSLPGDSVIIDIYVNVFGNDSSYGNEGLNSSIGYIRSSNGGLLGNLQGLTPPSPFDASPRDMGFRADFDGDGDLDIGAGGISDGYLFRAGSLVGAPRRITHVQEYFVGQVSFTCNNPTNASTQINWVVPTSPLFLTVIQRDGVDSSFENTPANLSHIAIGTPVTILGTPPYVPPNDVHYLSGTITDHLSITNIVQPTPGTTLIFATGADITAAGTLDMRNADGSWGTHEFHADDATSGNAGGNFFVGSFTVGYSNPGTFTHSAGTTTFNKFNIGSAAAAGVFTLTGGNVNALDMALKHPSARFEQSSGSCTVNSIDASIGTFLISGDGNFTTSMATLGPGYHQTGGTFTALNNITATGMKIDGGDISANWFYVSGQDTIQNGGTATYGFLRYSTDHHYQLKGGTLNVSNAIVGDNWGQLDLTGGTFTASSFLVNPQRPVYLNGSTVAIATSSVGIYDSDPSVLTQTAGKITFGTLTVVPSATYRYQGGTLDITKQLNLLGTLDLGGLPLTLHVHSGAFIDFTKATVIGTANATLLVDSGALVNYPAGSNPSSYFGTITNHGLSHVSGQPLHISATDYVGGTGAITGNVSNDGTLSPGHSPGILKIEGDYDQSNSGTLVMELAGTTSDLFDNLTVTGNASLNGNLDVQLLDGFLPSPSDSFHIISSNSLTGQFVNAPASITIPQGVFSVQYSPSGVSLSNFAAAPEPSALLLLGAGLGLVGLRRRRN